MRAWKLFGDAMGTDVLAMYEGTFAAGELGFRQAKATVDEAAKHRTNNALNAIPSLKLFISYLPKIKEKFGAGSTTYLACFLQVRLWVLRDNWGASRYETPTAYSTIPTPARRHTRIGTTGARGS